MDVRMPIGLAVTAAALAGAAALTLASRPAATSAPPAPHALHAPAAHAAVQADGRPVVLNGVNVVPVWRTRPGRTWAQARYDAIAAKGFNSVRFVLYWDALEPARGHFNA